MRLHTDVLTYSDFYNALEDEKTKGRIAESVGFKILERYGSRDRARAFEVQLESYEKQPGDGRRYGNSGSYGSGENYTATYDEWGWLFAALFEKDPDMRAGSKKHPAYAGADDFHHKTGLTYDPATLIYQLTRQGYDPYPFKVGREEIGRRGAGRIADNAPSSTVRYAREEERDVSSYFAFAFPRGATADDLWAVVA